MAIVCAISVENQKKFKKSLANVLAGYMAANEPLDIKAISKDVHSQIEEIYKDMPDQKIKALSYVMLVPDSIIELTLAARSSDNEALKEYLTNNVNLKTISDLSDYFKKSFDNIANYIGNEEEEYENLENNVEILLSASLSGNVENFKVSNGVAINNKSIFNATIPSVFKTAIGNVISSKEGAEGFNVERESTAYISNIKKMLIEKVNSGSVKEDTAVLPEVGPVFLAPITLETLNNISTNYPQEVKDYIVKTGVGLVMIDIEGNPVYFDKNLNPSITNTSGKLFVDSMPEINDQVIKRSLEIYQKKYNATPVEAQGLLDAELKRMEDIRTFIENNPDTILKLNIKGGKSGYAHFDFRISNPVNSINFGQDEFLPEIATQDIAEENISKGKMYFRLSSLPGIPIEIERVTIATSFATQIATLLTTDLKVMKKGYPVKAPDSFRKLISSYYLNTNSNDFSVAYDPETKAFSVTILGKMVDLSDRKKAFNTINNYLTGLGPKRRLEEADAMARQERGARIINREDARQTKLQVGDIIRTKQGNTAVYDIVEYPKLQFSKEALKKGYYEFELEPDMDGHILKLSKKDTDDYKEFIKENSYIHYQLNAERKVVSMNPYLTFDVPQESLDMLYPPVDTSKDIKAEPEIGDTDYDYLADWDELPKTVKENLERNGITREQLEEARVWYENSEYNKVAPFKVFFDQINAKNPNDVATFTKSAVTLWKGSDYSDLYHEAWHVFTRTFLKPEQLKALFDELKIKHKNKIFTDYKGNKVKFGDATYKQIDEFLAEDFREYMLNGGKPKSGFEKRNTLFRYLARIVKAIAQKLGFNTSMFDERNNEPIYELYNKIRVGNITELTMQQENPGFYFAKTLEATDPENPVQALNTEASNAFLQATDYYIADYMDTMNQKLSPELSDVYNTLKTRIDNGETLSADEQLTYQRLNKKINGYFTTMDLLKPEGIKNAYKHVKRNFVRLHNQYANDLNVIKDDISDLSYGEIKAKIDAKTSLTFGDKRALVNIINSQEFKIKKKQVDYFYWAIQNFGDTENIKKNKKFKGIIGYHFNKSDYISKQIIENVEKELQTQQDKEDFKGFENIGNEDSAINMLPKEIMYLLKGLTRYDSKGNVDVNPLTGVPKLVEYKKVANKLFHLLAGVTTPQQMADIIKKEQKNYPAFKQLLGRLGRTDVFDKEGEYQMWSKFFMGMNLTRRSPKVVNLNKVQEKNENGTVTSETFDINVGGSPNMDIEFTVSRWKLNIQNLDLEGYKEDRYGKLMGFEELKKLILKYPAINNTNSFDFLKALGIVMPDAAKENSLDLKEITRRTSFIYSKLRNAYFYHLNKDVDYTFNPIRDLESIIKPFSTEINELNKDLGTDIRRIADIANKYSDSVSNFMYTSATLNQQYELTKNSSITQKLNAINNAEDFNALVSKPETSHYSIGRNFFVKRSIHFNTIFNLDAVNGPKRVYATTGLQEKVKGEGRPVDITINDFNGVVSLVNNVATEFGEVSSGLDDFGKFMADFYASLGGITELPRHADKSSYSSVILRLYRVGNLVRNKYTEAKDLIHHNDLRLADYKKLIYLQNKVASNEKLTTEEQLALNNLEGNVPEINELNFLFEKVIMQYLLGEYERMMAFRQMQQDYDNRPDGSSMEMDFAYLKRGQNFVIFDDILSPQTKAKIEALSEELKKTNTDLDEYFMDNPKADLKFEIMSDFRHYFENLTNETIDNFIRVEGKMQFVSPKMVKELRNDYSREQMVAIKGDRNDVVLRGMARAFNLMTFISNMESNIMFYGDPAQYDDYTKRIALQGSAGTVPRNDSVAHEHINQKGRLYAKSKGFADKYPMYQGILRTGVFQDVKMKSIYFDEFLDILKNSELKKLKKSSKTKGLKKAELESMALKNAQEILEPYTKMTEADGQAWITFDTYRYLLDSYGMWPQEMEDLYQSIVNGTFDPEMDVMSFFPVLKLQYSGPVYHPSAAIETAHKYSLFPLIPPVIAGRNLEDLHDRLMNQGLDYAVLSSGAKVGVISKNGSIDKIYENYSIDQDERKPLGIDEPVTINEIYVPYLKYQTHIEPSYKGKVTLPTQMRTLVLSDLFERGVPVDFKTSITDKDERRLLWDKLSDKQKSKESKIYNNEAKYLQDLQDLVNARKKKLLRKISFKEVDGRIEGPMDKLLEFVERELERQELSQEDIDFITQMREGKFKDLSLSVHAEKMERLLNAIIIKEIGKPKVKGEGLIQVSNMLFEKKESWTEARKGLSKSGKYKVYGSNDYPFYRADVDKKGNITKVHLMKIGIAMQGDFKLLLKDADVLALAKAEGIIPLEALNKLIKDEEWLNKNDNRRKITLTGPRIPSQKQNSLEAAEVYEFFPEAAGNIVVLPSEIVAKSGGDFDVDKLFMLMPHLTIRKGKVELYKKLSKKQLEDYYIQYKLAKVGSYDTPNALADAMSKALGIDYNELIVEVDIDEMFDYLLKEEKAMTLEQFEEFMVGSKGPENELIKSFVDLLTLPEAFVSLITPNSTRMLERLSKELEPYNSKVNVKRSAWSNTPLEKMSMTRVLEAGTNRFAHTNNSVGKSSLGIGAVDNRWSPLFNEVGMYLNQGFYDYKGRYHRVVSKLNHNVTIINGVPHISISDIDDVFNEENIGDKLSEKINGWVDVAKNPWIFYIRGNKIAAPVLLFLTQIGTPARETVYFASQPMIREYVEEIERSRSVFAEAIGTQSNLGPSGAVFEARKRMIKKYEEFFLQGIDEESASILVMEKFKNLKTTEILSATESLTEQFEEAFDPNYLKQNVNNKEFNMNDFAQLLHYFELEDYANQTKNVKLKLNFDTAKASSLFTAMQRKNFINEVKASDFFPAHLVDKLVNNTPLAPFAVQDFQIKLLGRLFPVRNNDQLNSYLEVYYTDNELKNILYKVYHEQEDLVNTFKNDFMNFLFQTKLKDFNLKKLQFYNGLDVTTEIKEAPGLDISAVVMEVKGVKQMYVNSQRINREFKSMYYNKPAYEAMGNATVPVGAFNNISEYQEFVLERAMLTDRYPISTVLDRIDYKIKFRGNLQFSRPRKDETNEEYMDRISVKTYREWLRDMALFNTNNIWHLFKSPNNYAITYQKFIETVPELENYSIKEGLRVTPKGNDGINNIVVRDPSMDIDTEQLYKDNIAALSNYSTEITGDKQTDEILTHFFRKMPVVAMFQTGYNMKGMYNITRLVPKDGIYEVVDTAAKQFLELTADEKLRVVDNFMKRWLRENNPASRYTARAKVKDFSKVFPTEKTNVQNALDNILGEYGNTNIGTYDVTKINNADAVDAILKETPNDLYVYEQAYNQMDSGGMGWVFSKGLQQNKIGIETRILFNVTDAAKYKDIKNSDGTSSPNPELVKNVDLFIEKVLKEGQGKKLRFPAQGIGQYMVGLDEVSQRREKDPITKYDSSKAVAPLSFQYLSEQLFKHFQYVNPNSLDISIPPITITKLITMPVVEVTAANVPVRLNELNQIEVDGEMIDRLFEEKAYTKDLKTMDGSVLPGLPAGTFNNSDEYSEYLIYREKAKKYVTRKQGMTDAQYFEALRQESLKKTNQQRTAIPEANNPINAGTMNMNIGMVTAGQTKPGFFRKELMDKKITSTWYAVVSGLRTQTTRINQAINYNVGDYIYFTNTFFTGANSLKGKKLVVKVTNIINKSVKELLAEDPNYAETWSKNEGWTPGYIKDNPNVLSKYPVQFEYVGIQNEDGTWQNIDKKYTVAPATTEIEIPVTEVIPSEKVGIRPMIVEMMHPDVTNDMVLQKLKFCGIFGR